MNSFITVKDLADMLGIDRRNLRKKVVKEKVKTFKAPVMTRKGPQMALWVPASYALELVKLYEVAKANSNNGGCRG